MLRLPGLIVEPAWLGQQLDHPGLRLLDLRPQESFAEAHIPGAVQVDLESLTAEVAGVPGMLLPAEAFAARMGELGVDETRSVVLYDDTWGLPSARVLWGLARYGHTQAAILNGGWDRWQAEDRPGTQTVTPPLPTRFTPRSHPDQLAERAWITAKLDDPDTVFVDTRTPNEYAQGHLPNALCWDWMNGVPPEGWDTLRHADDLRADLISAGITPDKEIVTYCRSGVRAAHTYLLLRHLGYPRVRNYDGSWLEWSQQ